MQPTAKRISLKKGAAVLCLLLMLFNQEKGFAQVIDNTGGAVLTVTSGTVLNADVINNDNTPSVIDNAGTINVSTVNNNGTMQGNGTYNVSGVFTNTGTFNPGTSTFVFNGSGAQTISPFTFYHLTLSNAGAKTAGGPLTVSGDLTMNGAASFDAGTSLTHNFAGNWIVNTSAGTPLTYTTSSTVNFNTPGVPAATSISGTTTATIGFDNININNTSGFSNNDSISAAGILAIASNITFTNNAKVSVTGNITGGNAASTLLNSTNGVLNAGSALLTTGTLTATAVPNTVNYTNSTGAQTVKATTYHHLGIDKTAQVATINATMTVNGNVNVLNGSLTVSAGTFTVTGIATINGTYNMGAATAIAMNGGTVINGTLNITSATGTKDFSTITNNGTMNFSVIETATLSSDLILGTNGIITGTATGIINVGGNLNITGTGNTIGRSTITVSGTTNITGAVDFNSLTGTKTFVGLVSLTGSGAWSNSANSAFILQGGLTHDGTSFSSGTGVYTFNTNPQSIAGASQLTINSVTATAVTITNDNTNINGLTISTALAGTGGLTNPINGLLNIGGTSAITTLTATAVPNTVSYISTTGAQTVKATTYHHLIIDKTAQIATINATATVIGDLTVTSGTLTVSAGVFIATGAITINGTMTMGAAASIAMNSTTNVNGTLTITSATGTKDFTNLNINANATLNLNAAETATLSGNLVMANNSVITGTATGIVNVGGNLNITGTGTSIGRSTITVSGTTTVTGDVDFNSATGTKTFTGLVTITSPGTWSSSANSACIFQGGLQNDNTFSSGTGTYTFNTNSQTLSGTGGLTFDGTVAIVGAIIVDVNTTSTFNGSITGSVAGSTLQAGTGITINLLGAAVLATGTLDLTTNTPNNVVYAATSLAQTVKGTTYYNLEINGNDQVKTIGAATTVNNLLTVTAGTLNLSTQNLIMGASAPIILNDSLLVTSATGTRTWSSLTINASGTFSCSAAETFNVSGNWTNNGGTFTPGTSTVTFDGTGPQAINGTAVSQSFNNIIVSNSASTLSVVGSTTTLTLNGTFTQTLGDFTAPATMNVTGAMTFTVGTFTAGADLNVGGNWISATGTVFIPGTGTVTFNGTGAQQIAGTSVTKTFNNLVINKTVATLLSAGGGTTTITVTGTLTHTQGNFTPPATLNVSGIATLTDGTFSLGAGTKTFSLDLNINSTAIFSLTNVSAIANIGGDLNMNGTGSITGTATGTINITNDLNINGTGNAIGRSTITVNGTTNVTGDVDFNSATGTKTFIGLVTISGVGAWSSSLNSAFIFQGGLTHNGTAFTSGTGIYTFNTNPQNIDGSSPLTFASLTATGITVSYINSNIAGLTVTTALSGTGGLTMPVNGLLILGGTSAITTLTVNANPNIVRYNSTTAAQTVKATTYHHLEIDKTGQIATITGTVTMNGNLTVTSGTLALGNSTVVVGGTTTVDGTLSFTNATGTKDFVDLNLNANGILNFTVAETATLSGNLTMGNNSTITGTLTGIVSVGGNLNITGTGTTIGQSTITIAGATTVTGDVNFNSATGTKTFVGLVTISAGASWTSTANSAFILRGGLTHNGTTFSSGTGTYTFNTNNQNINGSSSITFDGTAAITGAITVTNFANVTLVGDLTGSVAGSTWYNEANSTLNVGAIILTTGTLTATGNPNTVNYNGGAQTIKGATYYHLQITTAGAKTAGAAITVNGDLTITGIASFDDAGFQISGNASGSFSLAVGTTLSLGNAATATIFPTNFTNGNTTLNSTSTVIYNSDQAQVISAVPTYGHLTLTSTASVTKTISGTLTTAGDITVNTNNILNITGAGDVTVGGSVNLYGNLTNAGLLTIGP